MKSLSKISSKIRANSASLVGVMVFLLFAQQIHVSREIINIPVKVSSSQSSQSSQSSRDGDDNDEPGQTTILNIDHDIIASGAQFNVNHVFYEIMNIEQDEEEDDFENAGVNSFPDDFRKVLFCQVISPNAP